MSRAEATGRLARETAESSIMAFENAIGRGEDNAELPDETEGTPEKTPDETIIETVSTTQAKTKGENEAADTRDQIESRLEFLARMYEARKARSTEEEAEDNDKTG